MGRKFENFIGEIIRTFNGSHREIMIALCAGLVSGVIVKFGGYNNLDIVLKASFAFITLTILSLWLHKKSMKYNNKTNKKSLE